MLVVCFALACATAPDPRGGNVDGAQAELESEWLRRVDVLAGPERPARGLGEPGLERAGRWIAAEFAKIGLEKVGGSYVQEFSALMPSGESDQIFNVLGRLPSTREGGGQILLSAHYDSLNTRDGVKFPGADDNASGVATMLALAEALSRIPDREHTIVFAAFTAEEDGFVGSQYYVDHADELPKFAVVLDMVGRLDDGRLYFDASTRPLEHTLVRHIRGGLTWRPLGGHGRSDALPFRAAGVETVVVSSGLHEDYHRPTDTVGRLRVRDAIRIYEVLRLFVGELVTRSGAPSSKGRR